MTLRFDGIHVDALAWSAAHAAPEVLRSKYPDASVPNDCAATKGPAIDALQRVHHGRDLLAQQTLALFAPRV